MPFTIDIIGSLDNQVHYDLDTIKKLFLYDAEALIIGNHFVGRPGTRIHASEHDVIKIRTELNFSPAQSKRWIKQALEKEQQLGVHHPHKTWLLMTNNTDQDSPSIAIASICPRLKPLHIELKAAPTSTSQRQHYLHLLTAVLRMYLTLAKQTDYKLDEGLSNFAIDENNVVYYLDDEYYKWDSFVSLATMIGVYIRTFEWLDEAFIREFGDKLIEMLASIFHDDHCRVIIARQLHSLFMPVGQKEQLVHALMQTLTQQTNSVVKIKPVQVPSRFFALLADIHANYAALDCVLNYLAVRDIEQGIVLGDVVGYNAEPAECIERLQNSNLLVIKGNHDHAVAMGEAALGFSVMAKVIIDWTIKQLSDQQRDWLKNLPAFEENEDWFAVHGAPMDPAFFYGYVYIMTYEDNLNYMQKANMRLCFHGHSHMPGGFARDKKQTDHILTDKKILLSAYNQLLICPGSVGQPRNGCCDAQFAIYDRQLQEISFITLPYNTDATVQKMRNQGFSEILCQRLLTGR